MQLFNSYLAHGSKLFQVKFSFQQILSVVKVLPGEKKKERPKVGNNNGQLIIATPPQVAHAKLPDGAMSGNIYITFFIGKLPGRFSA